MTGPASLAKDARTLTVRVPFALRKRGGRKLVVAPEGATWGAPRPRVDSTMVKALARAFRWRKLLESGVHGTIDEIAKAEKINESYVGRILRLTLLAPEIVEAILAGGQPARLQMDDLMTPFSVDWRVQREAFGFRK